MKPKRLKIDRKLITVDCDTEEGWAILHIQGDHNNDWNPCVVSMTVKQVVALQTALSAAHMELNHAKVTKLIKKERKR